MRKISIITPSFNQGQFLEQTIDSVLSQQYPNLEYSIIDGGSTDNSVEIIKKHAKHLHYWVSEKDKGQSDAINKGLKIANGEIINWLNSDDFYEPNTLSKINKYFEEEHTLVVAGKSKIWKQNKVNIISNGTDVYDSTEKTIGFARIDQPETFFKKKAIEAMGLLHPNLHFVMDREWWIRYLLLFGIEKIKKVDDVFVNFRIHEHSKTNNFQDKFTQENLNVYYTLAVIHKLPEAKIFEQFLKVEFIAGINEIQKSTIETVQKAIHYFWLQQAYICYAQNKFELTTLYFSFINPTFLHQQDCQNMKNIQQKIKYIPKVFKKIFNKIR